MGRGPGVRATSATSIQIDFRYKGVRCRERLSLPPTPKNLKYAARLKATIDHEIATNTFDYSRHFPESPRAKDNSGAAGIPLRRALLDYCDSLVAQLQPETVDEYRHDAEIIAAGLPGHTIRTLKRKHVRDWVSTLNLTKKRIDNILIPLRGALDRAVEDEEIDGSPLAGFKIRRTETQRENVIDPFTPEEIDALAGGDLGYLWEFWAWSGLRSGELIGLEWPDVAPKWASIAIRRAVRVGRTKTPKSAAGTRVVDLVQPARRAVASLVEEASGPVFRNPNTGERWHEDRALARAFRRDCKAAGVRYRYPYQLRHTFATWALSSGENAAWAAKQMGHKDVMMFFKVYAKWMQKLDPKAGSRMVKAVKSKAA